MDTAAIIVVAVVILLRLFLPLTIPYWPLIGVISCLVLDAADQSIFQQFPDIPLDNYQSYDKALDIYYLAIAYLATLRNWTNLPSFRVSRFLYYYRLVGVVAFELSGLRALLLVFRNTFEYFFIFCEGVRARWNTARITMAVALVAAALIWIFIKLPQEWWIHIAKLDMTDFIKESLFGASKTDSWGTVIATAPLVLVALLAALAVFLVVCWLLVTRVAPPADHRLRFKADPLPTELRGDALYRTVRAEARLFDRALIEKIVLTGLTSIVFAQMLLGDGLLSVRFIFVALFVLVNAMVSQWLARRGRSWKSVASELVGMMIVNFGIVMALLIVGDRILRVVDTGLPLSMTIFTVFLFTVITVLFDRYHTVFQARGMVAQLRAK